MSPIAAAAHKVPIKRPLTAYVHFVQENKGLFADKSRQPRDTIKAISERWNTLDSSERARYEDRARASRAEYERERDAYLATLPPKRPMSSYARYFQERYHSLVTEHPEWTVADFGRHIGSEWRNLDSQVREKYQEHARREMEQWKSKYGTTGSN